MFAILLNTSAASGIFYSPAIWSCAMFAVLLIAAYPQLTQPEVRKRLTLVLVLLLVLSVPATVLAIDLYAPCEWDAILDLCGGSELCAWAYWWWAACPVR